MVVVDGGGSSRGWCLGHWCMKGGEDATELLGRVGGRMPDCLLFVLSGRLFLAFAPSSVLIALEHVRQVEV